MYPQVLGLDIGGANLKAAHSSGPARRGSFELWKQPENLSGALCRLLESWPSYDLIAVTMTGELCDCFGSRREGVQVILKATTSAAGSVPIKIWQVDGRFVSVPEAATSPLH